MSMGRQFCRGGFIARSGLRRGMPISSGGRITTFSTLLGDTRGGEDDDDGNKEYVGLSGSSFDVVR